MGNGNLSSLAAKMPYPSPAAGDDCPSFFPHATDTFGHFSKMVFANAAYPFISISYLFVAGKVSARNKKRLRLWKLSFFAKVSNWSLDKEVHYRKTCFSTTSVWIDHSEYSTGAPRFPVGAANHDPCSASGSNQNVMSPGATRARSYADQWVTR